MSCKSTPPPEKPIITPSGPEVKIFPGKKEAIRATSQGATKFRWALQGDGNISSSSVPDIFYISPVKGGGVAILTVFAYNEKGDSSQSSITLNIVSLDSVRLETLAIPAGWISGGGNPANYISMGSSPDNCYTGSDCRQIRYRTGGNWGGIYWWPLACGESGTSEAWNRVRNGSCGTNLLEVSNLSEIINLTFWARGRNGNEVIEFKVGGPDINPKPGKSTGKVTLTQDWKQYKIDLKNVNLTNAIGMFVWVASDFDNPQGATFYLDDIQFNGVK